MAKKNKPSRFQFPAQIYVTPIDENGDGITTHQEVSFFNATVDIPTDLDPDVPVAVFTYSETGYVHTSTAWLRD